MPFLSANPDFSPKPSAWPPRKALIVLGIFILIVAGLLALGFLFVSRESPRPTPSPRGLSAEEERALIEKMSAVEGEPLRLSGKEKQKLIEAMAGSDKNAKPFSEEEKARLIRAMSGE